MQNIVYVPLAQQSPTNVQPQNNLISIQSILLQYGKRIEVHGRASGLAAETTLYTVPTGKYFFLLTAHLCVFEGWPCDGNFGALQILPRDSTGTKILQIELPEVNDYPLVATSSVSPSIPLKMIAGKSVQVYNLETFGKSNAQITGYEIDQNFVKDIA